MRGMMKAFYHSTGFPLLVKDNQQKYSPFYLYFNRVGLGRAKKELAESIQKGVSFIRK
jgi:hypothetical protein